MSFEPKVSVETRYVLDIRIQRVEVVTAQSKSVTNTVIERARDVAEVAHYVVSEEQLAAALAKGLKLLKLTGESAGEVE